MIRVIYLSTSNFPLGAVSCLKWLCVRHDQVWKGKKRRLSIFGRGLILVMSAHDFSHQ